MTGQDRLGLGSMLDQVLGGMNRFRQSVQVPLEFSRDEVQSRLDRLFPIAGERYGLQWRARDPVLGLHDEGYGTLQVSGDVTFLGQTLSGQAHLRGELAYEAQQQSFYLRPLYVTSLQVGGLSALTLPIKSRLNRMLSEFAEDRPVFRLDRDSARHQWVATSLHTIEIRRDCLRLWLRPLR